MSHGRDLTRKVFGRLTVLYKAESSDKKNSQWVCSCECGKKLTVKRPSLIQGKTKSCGCLNNEKRAERAGLANLKHGLSKHPLAKIHNTMIRRCYNENFIKYKDYGGRGIRVCDRWHNVENFIKDMESTYKKGLSLDRIDNDGDYSPENCRWTTPITQGRNKRNNKIFSFEGEDLCAAEICEKFQIKRSTFLNRINRGWSLEEALKGKK